MLYGSLTNLPRVIAHRGARSIAPENTIISMQKAKELSATWVEFDVMLAACGEAIVIHDTSVKRTTSGRGQVGKLLYSQIKEFDAGSWFNPCFSKERIPTLIEMLKCLEKYQLNANIEIKPYPKKDEETAINALKIIQQHWPKKLAPPLLSSFSLTSLRTLRKYDQKILLGLLLDKWNSKWQVLADELNCVTVHLNYKIATPNRVAEIKKTGRAVLCYTVNSITTAKKLFAMGVDSVFSDHPELFLEDIVA